MVVITADLKTKGLALRLEHCCALYDFHEISRAEGPTRQYKRAPLLGWGTGFEIQGLLVKSTIYADYREPR
jgi:hypothetical protein